MKLEDIKKKNIYSVPDRYFDQLPTRIQSRVNEKKPVLGLTLDWSLVFRVAVPVLTVVFFVFYFSIGNHKSIQSAEELLAQIDTDDIIAYLQTTDITTDEIIEGLDLSDIELDFYDDLPIMQDLDMSDQDIDALLDEYGIYEDILDIKI